MIEWVHKCRIHSVVDLQLSFRLEGIILGILIAHDILDYSGIIENNAGIMESSTQYGDQVEVTTKKSDLNCLFHLHYSLIGDTPILPT